MNSRFFYLRHSMQQLLVLLGMLALFLFGYLYFIVDLQQLTQQQKQLYQDAISDIELLESRLKSYSTNQHPTFRQLPENELAHLFISHSLALQTFRHDDNAENHWYVELKGNYADFVTLLQVALTEHYYFDFQDLLITKTQDKQLLLAFTLQLKDGRSKK